MSIRHPRTPERSGPHPALYVCCSRASGESADDNCDFGHKSRYGLADPQAIVLDELPVPTDGMFGPLAREAMTALESSAGAAIFLGAWTHSLQLEGDPPAQLLELRWKSIEQETFDSE